jgi:hypothetical protein
MGTGAGLELGEPPDVAAAFIDNARRRRAREGVGEDVRFGRAGGTGASGGPPAIRASLPGFLRRVFGSNTHKRRPADALVGSRRRPLDAIVALQFADGSWKLDDELARALGWSSEAELLKALSRKPTREAERRAAATALALAWLERECGESRDEWRLLAEKAREWLARVPGGGDDWLEVAKGTLSGH